MADVTLNQVRKKMADIKAMIDFCATLRKLRKIRRQHARDKNSYPRDHDPNEQDFECSLQKIEDTLKLQMTQYEHEKQSLICLIKVLMVSKSFRGLETFRYDLSET